MNFMINVMNVVYCRIQITELGFDACFILYFKWWQRGIKGTGQEKIFINNVMEIEYQVVLATQFSHFQ